MAAVKTRVSKAVRTRSPPAAKSKPARSATSPPMQRVAAAREWWMLVHQLPPDPPGLRMRVWRRLQELGALQIKGSVYVLPATDQAREDLQWLFGEIRAGNGEASLWRAGAVEGLSEADLVLRFQAMAGGEYENLEADAQALRQALSKTGRSAPASGDAARQLARLRSRFDDIGRRDYFGASRREVVARVLTTLDRQLAGTNSEDSMTVAKGTLDRAAYRGRTWVTRANVRVDRMASAWLIARFIDPSSRFVFTRVEARAAARGRVRFDMYGGEFTHVGDLCTFEVLLRRFGLTEPGLAQIGQLVHDIDLKESRYAHAETAGVAASLDAIAEGVPDDHARVAMAGTLFDGLLKHFAQATRSASSRTR